MNFRAIVSAVAAATAASAQPASTPATSSAFEVATIKPTPPDWSGGALYRMRGAHQFEVINYSLRAMIGAAYDLSGRMISGGPPWATSDRFNIIASTPGDLKPKIDQQMAMLRTLLAERFKLEFHREQKDLPIYALKIANHGPKLKPTTAPPDQQNPLIFTLFPDHASLPARNATMEEFASVLQRGAVSRPVVDETGVFGRYDFDLDWTPDESQFGGRRFPEPPDPNRPDPFAALQEQLGLKLEAKNGPVQVFVIDHAERPTEN